MSSKVNVYDVDGKTVAKKVERPAVFDIELRDDLVQKVHSLVSQNSRQPYAVSPLAGMQHSAVSWGTGRAVARVPRVKGSGTRRAGQAAFAPFCRKGRMAHPTKTHRRWHRKTPLCLRRTVTAMSVAATANPAIVEARGHRCSNVPMLPLVVSDNISSLEKTKQAVELLGNLGLGEECQKVKDSKSLRRGKGKFRNRRFIRRKGLLIIHDGSQLSAFRGIVGVDQMDVNSLDLLELSPGGKMGRLVMWTESAFNKLSSLFGTFATESEIKKGYSLPLPLVTSDNLDEYFYSSEIQSLIKCPNMLPSEDTVKTDADIAQAKEFIGMYEKIVAN
ncbi:uncharacterized protein VICG_00169 [Vittaforma corneae ATCC 50505]|uniref:Large ribosomal subunit protein uL4 n=1 Tax=Vittaforma corneae (strain ATCC 50505) TaxID=993615 RepID=L2GQF4_VITCO|nr:uncharacterized protein VICG_00169 [Vittaforma corneae ATCC 50505]ELA42854.1 hypothetical protein VICG_00169 [Vittaforma corneae ATCC 50505]